MHGEVQVSTHGTWKKLQARTDALPDTRTRRFEKYRNEGFVSNLNNLYNREKNTYKIFDAN